MRIQFRDGARGQNLESLMYIPNAAGPSVEQGSELGGDHAGLYFNRGGGYKANMIVFWRKSRVETAGIDNQSEEFEKKRSQKMVPFHKMKIFYGKNR